MKTVPSWVHPELLKASGTAFFIALVLTPILRDVFRSFNIVDQPGQRKVHAYPIPRIGGIPIVAGYFTAVWMLSSSHQYLGTNVTKLLPGVLLVFVIGLIDDFFDLRPVVKLIGQVAAALLVYTSGLSISMVAGQPLPQIWDLILTVLWLLLSTNALNLIDGLDGLCAGIGLVATATLLGAALLHGNDALVIATLPLMGALLGFISYNMNPATVFLGDSGALTIGFLLGCYGMIWTQKTATLLSMLVPLLALAVPLLDVSLAIMRRFLSNRPVFSADRAHIHHRLLDRGLSPRNAVFLMYLFSAIVAAIAVLLTSPLSKPYQTVIGLVILGLILASVRQLRYQEFQAASQLLMSGEFQNRVRYRLSLDRFSEALQKASSRDEAWALISSFAELHGCLSVHWAGNGTEPEVEHFAAFGVSPQTPVWKFVVPLASGDLTLTGAEATDAVLDLPSLAWALQTKYRGTAAPERSLVELEG